MSCCCKTDNRTKTCNPCGFCMPPGVTGLTTCPPVGCDDKIDFCCAVYSGEDQACSDIYNNDPLCDILYKLLALAFPPEVCCELEGTIEIVTTTTTIAPTTTTSTTTIRPTTTTTTSLPTTTTTSSSTTTTTAAPITCNCFRLRNPTEKVKPFSWTDCSTLQVNFGSVDPGETVSTCSRVDGIIADPALVVVNVGLCSTGFCATTTTTVLVPCTTYTLFYNVAPGEPPATGTYTDCDGNLAFWLVGAGLFAEICALTGSVDSSYPDVLITNSGPCLP